MLGKAGICACLLKTVRDRFDSELQKLGSTSSAGGIGLGANIGGCGIESSVGVGVGSSVGGGLGSSVGGSVHVDGTADDLLRRKRPLKGLFLIIFKVDSLKPLADP